MRIDRSSVLTLGKYVIGFVALAWVIQTVQWDRALAVFSRLSLTTIAVVLVVTIGGLIARFAMWHVLIARMEQAVFKDSITIVLVTNFLNNVLPSRISGRSIAPLVIKRCTDRSWGDAVAITAVHTGLFAIVYAVVATIGIVVGRHHFSAGLLVLLGLSTGLYLIAGVMILGTGFRVDVLGRWLTMIREKVATLPYIGHIIETRLADIGDVTDRSTETFRLLVTDPRVVAGYVVAWIIGLAIAPGLRMGFLLVDLGVAIPLPVVFPAIVVAAYSVTLLPVTPGGIGVAEATATVVLVALGIPETIVVPVVLVDRLLGVYLPALAGWYPTMQLDLSADILDQG